MHAAVSFPICLCIEAFVTHSAFVVHFAVVLRLDMLHEIDSSPITSVALTALECLRILVLQLHFEYGFGHVKHFVSRLGVVQPFLPR